MSRHQQIIAAAFVSLAAVAILAPAQPASAGTSLPPIGCEESDKIDASKAADAKRKIEAAGFSKVHGLKKGCDSFWHGKATKEGVDTHVSLSPQGLVRPEGD